MSTELSPDMPVAAQAPFLEAMARQLNSMRVEYRDLSMVNLDFLFLCYLTLCSRFGRFEYGPISIELRVVEDAFVRSYPRLAPGEEATGYDDAAKRFYQRLSTELTRSGRRRIDELHWLLAFMRSNEGLPAKVFGEIGVSAEQVERFARGDVPERERRSPAEKLYSPEEVAEYLGIHVQTVRVWIRSGRLPALRLAGQRTLRIRESDLEKVLEPVELDAGEPEIEK